MTKQRVLPGLLIFLLAWTGYQSLQLIFFPNVREDLILNHQLLAQVVIDDSRNSFALIYETILKDVERATGRKLLLVKQELQCCKAYYLSSCRKFTEAQKSRRDFAIAAESVAKARAVERMMITEVNGTARVQLPFSAIEDACFKNDNLLMLRILDHENSLLGNYMVAIDYFSREGGPFCGFDNYTRLLTGNIGKRSVHDSLEVVIPSRMNKGQTERIQISFSKKFVDSLVDSLIASDTLDKTTHTDYVVTVSLVADDFELSTFDLSTQTITASDYTKWVFDMTPLNDGTKEIVLQVGLHLTDSLNNARIYELQIPLESVQVIH